MTEKQIRLDQTKKVFKAIAEIIKTGSCTYRYLIYDMLGFKPEDYVDLIDGLTITNTIVDYETLNEKIKQIDVIAKLWKDKSGELDSWYFWNRIDDIIGEKHEKE